jgi:hypothetical protein
MKIKMIIYDKFRDASGHKRLGVPFYRTFDENDLIRFTQHVLIEEGLCGDYDIGVDEVISN